jgi:hypothetical protein
MHPKQLSSKRALTRLMIMWHVWIQCMASIAPADDAFTVTTSTHAWLQHHISSLADQAKPRTGPCPMLYWTRCWLPSSCTAAAAACSPEEVFSREVQRCCQLAELLAAHDGAWRYVESNATRQICEL